MGYSPWGHKELDTSEQLTLSLKGPPEEDFNSTEGTSKQSLQSSSN